jgi:hypothetical protein
MLIVRCKNKEAKDAVILLERRIFMDMYNMNFPFLLLHHIIKEKLTMWLVLRHNNVQGAGEILLTWLQDGV